MTQPKTVKSKGYLSCEAAGIAFGYLSFVLLEVEYRFTQGEVPDQCFEAD